jgi:hypothetical protein
MSNGANEQKTSESLRCCHWQKRGHDDSGIDCVFGLGFALSLRKGAPRNEKNDCARGGRPKNRASKKQKFSVCFLAQ